jgi:hypothetical protein
MTEELKIFLNDFDNSVGYIEEDNLFLIKNKDKIKYLKSSIFIIKSNKKFIFLIINILKK